MKKKLLWEEIQEGLKDIKKLLELQEITEDVRDIEIKKSEFLVEVFMVIQYIGESTEKSSLKFEAWIHRGINQQETADRLGMTTDGLRATIWYFNSRIENIVGADTVSRIVNCKSQQELSEIESQFWARVRSLNKGYFR